jgi:hypothetical protein
MIVGLRFNELDIDSHPLADFLDAPFHNVADPQLPRDL